LPQLGFAVAALNALPLRDGRPAPSTLPSCALVAGRPTPVVHCHIEGAFAALPPHRRLPRPRRLRLRIGPPLGFSAIANDKAGWADIAARVQAAVEALVPS
jgi:hypothetical protein